jgi:hypothetical protein
MGYGMYFPAHQVGGQLELWGIRSYGVSGVWVKRSLTVVLSLDYSNDVMPEKLLLAATAFNQP